MDKSETERILGSLPQEGFLKVTRPPAAAVSSEQRVQLIRKGNELFGLSQWEAAKKIFVATHYTDGMIRLGDHYVGERDYLSAYQMYKLAPAPDQAAAMIQKLSAVLKNWLKE